MKCPEPSGSKVFIGLSARMGQDAPTPIFSAQAVSYDMYSSLKPDRSQAIPKRHCIATLMTFVRLCRCFAKFSQNGPRIPSGQAGYITHPDATISVFPEFSKPKVTQFCLRYRYMWPFCIIRNARLIAPMSLDAITMLWHCSPYEGEARIP